MKKTVIIIICVVVLLILVGGIIGFKSQKKGPANETKVRIETISPSEFVEIVNAPGEIRPLTKVDISAKVSARIMELPFEEGETVKAGDLLIQLDSKNLQSQLQSAEASRDAQMARIEVEKAQILAQKATLEGTHALLNKTKTEFKRQEKLFKSQDISQASYDDIQCTLQELQSRYDSASHGIKSQELNLIVNDHNLKAAQARVEEAKEALSYTTITSPMDGVITLINAEVGEVVMTGTMNNPGTIIMQVADLSKMLLVAELDETNVGQVQIGQSAKVHVPAFWEDEFDGVVKNIALTHLMSRTGAKYYKTEILLEGDVKKLYSGLTADVDIETNRHTDIIKVPSQAVMARRTDSLPLDITEDNLIVDKKKTDIPVVYRLIDNKAVVTPVKIGPSDLTHTLIREGINEGDVVIVGPYKILESLKHDQAVAEEKKEEDIEKDEAAEDGQAPTDESDKSEEEDKDE
ncbi:MAG: efflux RND transporter periplasmic adaptor subunit [Planctomycetota bacterium]